MCYNTSVRVLNQTRPAPWAETLCEVHREDRECHRNPSPQCFGRACAAEAGISSPGEAELDADGTSRRAASAQQDWSHRPSEGRQGGGLR